MRRLLTPFLCLSAFGQVPRIDVVDFYGLNKTPEAKVRVALGAKEGEPLPASKGDAEERLDEIPGVVESHLEAVWDAGRPSFTSASKNAARRISKFAKPRKGI